MEHRNIKTLTHYVNRWNVVGRTVLSFINIVLLAIATFLRLPEEDSYIIKIVAYLAAISSICFFAFMDFSALYYSRKKYLGFLEYKDCFALREEVPVLFKRIADLWIKGGGSAPIYIQADYYAPSYQYIFEYLISIIRNHKYEKFNFDKEYKKLLLRRLQQAHYIDCQQTDLLEFLYELPNKRRLLNSYFVNVLFIENYDKSMTVADIYQKTGYRCVLVASEICNPVIIKALTSESILAYFENLIDIDKETAEKVNMHIGGNVDLLLKNSATSLIANKFLAYVREEKPFCEMDNSINRAFEEMHCGNYQIADTRLDEIQKAYKKSLSEDMHRAFRFYYAKANVAHLLNRYDEAIERTNDLLYNKKLIAFNADKTVELLKAHCLKHTGQFEDALLLLVQLSNETTDINLQIKSMRNQIGNYLLMIFDKNLSFEKYEEQLAKIFNYFDKYYNFVSDDVKKIIDEGKDLYGAVYNWYKNGRATLTNNDIKDVEAAKTRRMVDNSRLKSNVTFVLGELYRKMNNYDEAMPLYFSCYCDAIKNHDYNMQIQTAVMIKYLEIQKGRPSKLMKLDFVEMQKKCIEKYMFFNKQLCEDILTLESTAKNEIKEAIIAKFESNMMIIL